MPKLKQSPTVLAPPKDRRATFGLITCGCGAIRPWHPNMTEVEDARTCKACHGEFVGSGATATVRTPLNMTAVERNAYYDAEEALRDAEWRAKREARERKPREDRDAAPVIPDGPPPPPPVVAQRVALGGRNTAPAAQNRPTGAVSPAKGVVAAPAQPPKPAVPATPPAQNPKMPVPVAPLVAARVVLGRRPTK